MQHTRALAANEDGISLSQSILSLYHIILDTYDHIDRTYNPHEDQQLRKLGCVCVRERGSISPSLSTTSYHTYMYHTYMII